MTARQRTWNGRIFSIPDKPIISANEARKILGKDYQNLDDAYLMVAISSLIKIASHFLDKATVPKNSKVHDIMKV